MTLTDPTPLSSYQPPADLLADRIVLVTGASDGIGRAVALGCARHGATVVALDRKRRRLETLYDEVTATGGAEPVLAVQDLAALTWEQAQAIAAGVGHDCGRLDALVHNAAVLGALAPLHTAELDLWDTVMRTNLHAPYLLTRALWPLLRVSDSASVIFTSADVGRRGRAYWGAYGVACAALEGLMQIWADEVEANTTIRINTLDPGPTRTQMRSRAYPGEDPETLPLPASIVAAYLYLLGEDGRHLRGQALSAQRTAEEAVPLPTHLL